MTDSLATRSLGAADDLWAAFRAPREKRAALLASARPFDVDEWRQGSVPATAEELADLEDFLSEREAEREL
jgi:hypothetical protein